MVALLSLRRWKDNMEYAYEKNRGTIDRTRCETHGSENTRVGTGGEATRDIHPERHGGLDATHGSLKHLPCIAALHRAPTASRDRRRHRAAEILRVPLHQQSPPQPYPFHMPEMRADLLS